MYMQGIEREYDELDTVWYLAGSLFKSYPFDSPTEAFSLNLFRQVGTTDHCIAISPNHTRQTCQFTKLAPSKIKRMTFL